MASVVETKERVNQVHIEGLALLKIVKHCHESLPTMVTGSLLGMTNGEGVLEITHAFPFPDSANKPKQDGDSDDAAGLEGHEFQLEMMRMLREVNVDNNCVGWYQSMYLGTWSTANLLENQWSYQTDLSENAVVVLYDPMQTSHGTMVLKCYRLSDETIRRKNKGSNSFLAPQSIFEEVPVTLTNPGLVRALLSDLADAPPSTTGNVADKDGLFSMSADTTFDRLDMSTNPYLEKHLEFLCGWVDDLASEQHKFQYYTRQLAREKGGGRDNTKNSHKRRQSQFDESNTAEAWNSSEAPRRMESLLISNQIQSYVDQMEEFSGEGLSKLYLMGGLHSQQQSSSKAES